MLSGVQGLLSTSIDPGDGSVNLSCALPAAPSGGTISASPTGAQPSGTDVTITFDIGDVPAGLKSWKLVRESGGATSSGACLGTFGDFTDLTSGTTAPTGSFTDVSIQDHTCNQYRLDVVDQLDRTKRYTASGPIIGPFDMDGDTYEPPSDCDDANPNVHPGATETANGVDDDCDGMIDEP